ncbi:MAG: pyruvate ferredoxin oxidoreductase subunit gamma [Patescibacteria group bacterium]
MIEIRIHGRGGQGSVTMAELLAEAAFYGGKFVQAFPNFGVERRGAPVVAYVRIDDKFIRRRSQVYAPDYIIVQDSSLIGTTPVFEGAKDDSIILINTRQSITSLSLPKGLKIKTINANGLALELLGKPIINTILLGAFASLSGLIELSGVEKAIRERFNPELAEKNVLAAKKGFKIISNN